MMSYADRPGWFESCSRAVDRARELRAEFFDHLYETLQNARLAPMMADVTAGWAIAQAIAIVTRSSPASRASGRSRSTVSNSSSCQ